MTAKKGKQEKLIMDEIILDDEPILFATSVDIRKLSARLNKQEAYNKCLFKYLKVIFHRLEKIEEEMKKNGAGSPSGTTSGTDGT